jgi:hypothetical protein
MFHPQRVKVGPEEKNVLVNTGEYILPHMNVHEDRARARISRKVK